jgi:hypothetical protein
MQTSISVFLGKLQLHAHTDVNASAALPVNVPYPTITHTPPPPNQQTHLQTYHLLHKCNTDMLCTTDASKPAVHNFHDQTMFT